MDKKIFDTIKKVIREAALAVDVAPPPAIYGQRIPGAKQQQAPTRISGQASGRFGPGGSGWTATKTIPRAAPMSKPTSRLGPGAGATQATPKVSSGSIGKAEYMGRNLPSFMKDKMDTVSRQMSKGFVPASVEKAVPTVAGRVAGGALRAALGPAGMAAAAVMEPTPAGEKMSEFERQKTLKSYNPFKSSGRSVDDYMKQQVTRKIASAPTAAEAPKPETPKVTANVPTPPSRPEYMTRGQAFSAARQKAGDVGKFEYGGKEFQSNIKGKPYLPTTQLKPTGVTDTESGKKYKK